MFDTTEYHRDLSHFVTSKDAENLRFHTHQEDTNLQFGHHLLGPFVETPIQLHTGRMGSPTMYLEHSLPQSNQFQLSTALFEPWFISNDSLRFYHSNTPRTDLSYSQGTGNLLQLRASHSQNIASNWSFGLEYNRTKSHNLYYNNLPLFNQERMTNIFSTGVYSHFFTPNHKYEVFGSFVNSKNTVRETFGIANSATFDLLSGRSKTYAGQANFEDAQNLFIERTWSVLQLFRPGSRTVQVNDSTVAPDTSHNTISSQWFHEIKYRRHVNRFTDSDPNLLLFPVRYVSLETHDSMFYSVLSNRIGKSAKITGGYFKYWIQHEFIDIKQQYFHHSTFNNVHVAAEANKNTSMFNHSAFVRVTGLGYNAGDFKVDYQVVKPLTKNNVGLKTEILNKRPDYNDLFFGSNNYYWNQPFNKMSIYGAKLWTSNKQNTLKLDLQYRNLNNYVFYDTSGFSRQSSDNIHYINATGQFKLTFATSWHWEQRLSYQSATSNDMPVPTLCSKTRLFKEGYLFNKNMWARIGVDVQYFTPYAGRTYNPIVRQMTLSNDEIGGFPMVDFFINSQVNSMELYVSTHHIAQGFFINDSFLAANYPLISRTFQFGVNWRLFD